MLKFLNVKYKRLAVARCCQKTLEAPVAAYGLFRKPLGQRTKSHRFHCRLDLSCLPGFLDLGGMLKLQIKGRQSGWRVTRGIQLSDTGRQDKLVGNVLHAPRWQAMPLSLVLGLLRPAGVFPLDRFHH